MWFADSSCDTSGPDFINHGRYSTPEARRTPLNKGRVSELLGILRLDSGIDELPSADQILDVPAFHVKSKSLSFNTAGVLRFSICEREADGGCSRVGLLYFSGLYHPIELPEQLTW